MVSGVQLVKKFLKLYKAWQFISAVRITYTPFHP